MIDNLFIIYDRLEGIFVDNEENIYELAGSLSYRTKEFEIIGLSMDKTKSIKVRGTFSDLKFKGLF